ncbi:MarR family winged helix-turn-helix transcriptional regulator [Oceanibacterium hippocampi]|uniref:Transcriptional repressor MprA n=1 Tax=Oceanibacterium hippocampi TaxID=745714 RepID=A0A1Y5SFJ3_9PROT|nr:MarR family transcriptional regulator [Oceanibacterium hippocampi]SLN39642.1 transcriptional repressor MprA [Oceanibacterium hippocampi]
MTDAASGHAENIVARIGRLSRLARERQFGAGLNPAQWEALRYLGRANRFSRSPGALAAYLGTTKGTASQTVIALEGKGLLHRVQCARDRRVIELELTDQGRALLDRDPLGEILRAAESLDPLTAALLADGLDRLLDGLLRIGEDRRFGLCDDCAKFGACAVTDDRTLGGFCEATGEIVDAEDQRGLCANFRAD